MVQQSKTIREKIHGSQSSKVADCIWLTALILKKQGKYDEAISHYESVCLFVFFFFIVWFFLKALLLAQNLFGANHPQTAMYLKTIADVFRLKFWFIHFFYLILLRLQSAYPKAQSYYLEALRVNRLNFGNMHPGVSECLDSLGISFFFFIRTRGSTVHLSLNKSFSLKEFLSQKNNSIETDCTNLTIGKSSLKEFFHVKQWRLIFFLALFVFFLLSSDDVNYKKQNSQ